MSNFKEFPIYKKRDGQSWSYTSYIYSDTFENAKKEFAKNMTKDNFELSNNIVWLDKELDGVKETGFYDLDCSMFGFFGEDSDKEGEPNFADGIMELFCSEEAINEGFDGWSEDVHSWELRNVEDGSEE